MQYILCIYWPNSRDNVCLMHIFKCVCVPVPSWFRCILTRFSAIKLLNYLIDIQHNMQIQQLASLEHSIDWCVSGIESSSNNLTYYNFWMMICEFCNKITQAVQIKWALGQAFQLESHRMIKLDVYRFSKIVDFLLQSSWLDIIITNRIIIELALESLFPCVYSTWSTTSILTLNRISVSFFFVVATFVSWQYWIKRIQRIEFKTTATISKNCSI